MEMKSKIMDESAVNRALKRISFEIEEKNKGFEDICLIGIKRRGVPLAKMIAGFIMQNENEKLPVGSVDITNYRDDISEKDAKNHLGSLELEFDINGKTVIIVDDVLYTGRSVRAAIEAVFSLGRPSAIQLAVLVDRGHRELPIRPDYVGKNIPTSSTETVIVCVPEYDGKTEVSIYQ